ncbi:helix-turn-helix domain-containing protein [Nonomuraea sp. NPDC059023]|uniref:AraC-like ligand-binding domain-containing protein n=1 Tax=unclassified Nonomuraea TaxID=2593643 RepID=UPI0036973859
MTSDSAKAGRPVWVRMSTDEVVPKDRADWYQDLVSMTVAPHTLAIDDPIGFLARAHVLSLGQVEVSRHNHAAHRAWRTPALIRRSDPEHYLFGVITYGRKGISQRRTGSDLVAGDAVLFDTSHPYSAGTPGQGETGLIIVHIPRTMINLPADRLDAALGRRFTLRHGIGPIVRRFLTSLDARAAGCAPPQLRALERAVLELVSGLLAQQIDAWDHLPAETRKQVLLRRIDAFIDHNLADLHLTPQTIAASHNVSLRSLYALFESRGESVAAHIRRRRLEQCKTDLADPAWLAQPVQVIGARWGFTRPSSFSRAFRQAFGTSPSTYRRSLPPP